MDPGQTTKVMVAISYVGCSKEQQHLTRCIVNTLAHGRCCCNFQLWLFKLISRTDTVHVSCVCPHVKRQMTCQTTINYLRSYWPRSMSPYGVTRPQLEAFLLVVWCRIDTSCYARLWYATQRNPLLSKLIQIMQEHDLWIYVEKVSNVLYLY